MPYAWIIDIDNLTHKGFFRSAKDKICGPSDAPPDLLDKLRSCHCAGDHFRTMDGDGNVSYEGLIIGTYHGFEPLDDFACPNAGDVAIQYYQKGKWRVI
jgi:hypothetical protein